MSEYLPASIRRLVVRRADSRCEYCRAPDSFSTAPFEIDHIWPQSRGGPSTSDNLAYICPNCNGSKNAAQTATDPESGEIVPLFHPRQHLWSNHFRWSADKLRIEGILSTGRATVVRLDLNRRQNVNLREVLTQVGLHPPIDR